MLIARLRRRISRRTAQLRRARGVDVDAQIARKGKRRSGVISVEATVPDPVLPQIFFRDPGHRFLIVQPA